MVIGRIFLIDDHDIVLVMLRRLITDMGGEIAGAVTSGVEAVPMILETAPDLVILDLSLPKKNGFEIVEELRARGARCRFLVFTGAVANHALERLHQMRFDGVVSKLSRISELSEGIGTVLSGRSYCCPLLKAKKTEYLQSRNCPVNLLTRREIEVLTFIGEAKSDDEISENLNLAPSTIQGVRKSLMHKLGFHSSPHLVRFAREAGYTEFAQRRVVIPSP